MAEGFPWFGSTAEEPWASVARRTAHGTGYSATTAEGAVRAVVGVGAAPSLAVDLVRNLIRNGTARTSGDDLIDVATSTALAIGYGDA